MANFETSIEACTSEKRTEDDWGTILDICERVEKTTNGPRDCLRCVVKRLKHRVPHVAMLALTLLDAMVKNCGKTFHKEMSSREFTNEVKNILNNKNIHAKVTQRFRFLVKKWAENEFKGDSELDLFVSMYQQLARDGAKFDFSESDLKNTEEERRKALAREEEDLAKAIALSLNDTDKKASRSKGGRSKSPATSTVAQSGGAGGGGGGSGGSGGGGGGLYPNSTLFGLSSGGGAPGGPAAKEPRKVRALYDFEAVEDNELTFKAGEIILVSDDSDANWWRGSNHRGEGLFPATFVSADLDAKAEDDAAGAGRKGVSFSGEVTVVEEAAVGAPDSTPAAPVTIDEGAIDECLAMLENADPTGEMKPDPPNMAQLEARCRLMTPLIDTELERIDRRHNDLAELNVRLMEALQLYNSLMAGGLKMDHMQAASMPPGALAQASLPPGASLPPVSLPPGALPPGQLPPGQLPPGQLPSVSMATGPMQPPPPPAAYYTAYAIPPPQAGTPGMPPQAPLPPGHNNSNMAPPMPTESQLPPHMSNPMSPAPSQNGAMMGAPVSAPYAPQVAGNFYAPAQLPPSQSPLL